MNCETCKERKMQVEPVPYIVHESAMARAERANKRLWIIVIILAVMLFGSNIAWTIYENQFDDVVETESYEAITDDGGTAIANGSGEVRYYGTSEVHENDKDTLPQDWRGFWLREVPGMQRNGAAKDP